jgi:hypothetical protein
MMINLFSVWDAMIGAYRDSRMADPWVVCVWVFCYGSYPMGHVFAEPVFWICNHSNSFISFNQLDM